MGHRGRAGHLVLEQVSCGPGAQRRSGRQAPASLRCSGLGGAGRSRRLGRAAPGVGDTRGAGEARRPHPALGRNRPGVAWAPGASGEETRAASTNTNTQPRPSSSEPSPPSEPQLRSGSRNQPVAVPRPRLRPAGALSALASLPRPALLSGSPSCGPRQRLAYAAVLSCSPSDRRHELQRRLPPADQHAGPHDPRGVRPRPAL